MFSGFLEFGGLVFRDSKNLAFWDFGTLLIRRFGFSNNSFCDLQPKHINQQSKNKAKHIFTIAERQSFFRKNFPHLNIYTKMFDLTIYVVFFL